MSQYRSHKEKKRASGCDRVAGDAASLFTSSNVLFSRGFMSAVRSHGQQEFHI